MPPSSNKRHLCDRTSLCHHCLQERHVSPNFEMIVPWNQYLQSWRRAHNIVEGRTLCNVCLTFKISVIQVLLQLQKGSRNFIKILGISLADSNETFPFKFCNRKHQCGRDKRNQNVDTWNSQYGFKLTKSRRKMLL